MAFVATLAGSSLFYVQNASAQIGTPVDLVTCSGYACKWCDVFALLQRVFNTAEVIIFPLVVIFVIYGAVLYIISSTSGSEEGLKKARATVTDAIIGLILILLTFVIVNATIIGITGSKLANFISIDCSVIDTGGSSLGDVPPPRQGGSTAQPGPKAKGTIAEQQARDVFKAQDPKIGVNHDECPDAVNRYKDCTNLAGMRDDTVKGIINANQNCEAYEKKSCHMIITGGTEMDGHNASDGASHIAGYKADFGHNAELDDYVMNSCGGEDSCYVGRRGDPNAKPPTGDGAKQYKLPDGSIWAAEPGAHPHWDVTFP